jgi:hypothetical protein
MSAAIGNQLRLNEAHIGLAAASAGIPYKTPLPYVEFAVGSEVSLGVRNRDKYSEELRVRVSALGAGTTGLSKLFEGIVTGSCDDVVQRNDEVFGICLPNRAVVVVRGVPGSDEVNRMIEAGGDAELNIPRAVWEPAPREREAYHSGIHYKIA